MLAEMAVQAGKYSECMLDWKYTYVAVTLPGKKKDSYDIIVIILNIWKFYAYLHVWWGYELFGWEA